MRYLVRRRFLGCLGCAATALTPFAVGAQKIRRDPARIVMVQSQERGHPCGQPQADGVLEALAAAGWTVGRNLSVENHYLDLYRTNTSPDLLRAAAAPGLASIRAHKPDLLFTLDAAQCRWRDCLLT